MKRWTVLVFLCFSFFLFLRGQGDESLHQESSFSQEKSEVKTHYLPCPAFFIFSASDGIRLFYPLGQNLGLLGGLSFSGQNTFFLNDIREADLSPRKRRRLEVPLLLSYSAGQDIFLIAGPVAGYSLQHQARTFHLWNRNASAEVFDIGLLLEARYMIFPHLFSDIDFRYALFNGPFADEKKDFHELPEVRARKISLSLEYEF
jgi:hypothetical protein